MDPQNLLFILATNSDRRIEIFKGLGLPFTRENPRFTEIKKYKNIAELVTINALGKARSVFEKRRSSIKPHIDNCLEIIVGCDTIVEIDGKVLGKPENREAAFSMIRLLSGKTHRVISGLALLSREFRVIGIDISFVRFIELSDKDIKRYITLNDYIDYAGGYAIQGKGALLIEEIKGSYFNIVGFPLELYFKKIQEFGIKRAKLLKFINNE